MPEQQDAIGDETNAQPLPRRHVGGRRHACRLGDRIGLAHRGALEFLHALQREAGEQVERETRELAQQSGTMRRGTALSDAEDGPDGPIG